MGSPLKIFREYCRNAREIGSILPDSRACVNTLLHSVPFGSAKLIVEFGSASGTVTREIIKRKRRDAVFVAFEINTNLYTTLKGTLGGENVSLINEDAYNCARALYELLGATGKSVDCIISTLPCSCIDFKCLMQKAVLPVLRENGHFVQYMHTMSMLKGFKLGDYLAGCFKHTVSDHVLFNIPPALVYNCDTVSKLCRPLS